MTENFYARWTGAVTDPDTGEPRDATLTSAVIDGELRGSPANRDTLARWAVWLATPDWLKTSPDCDATPDEPPTHVEIVQTDHPAHLTAPDVIDAVAHALTSPRPHTGAHGFAWT